MSKKLIFKEDVESLVKKVALDFDVYFPARDSSGDCQFVRFSEEKKNLPKLCLDYDNLVIPPKSIFFPQIERMFTFKKGMAVENTQPHNSLPKLIFGIRACDLRGLQFSDVFFKRNFEDKYYLGRIKNRLTVLVGCTKPLGENKCFCVSAKTGPFLEKDFDLQFTDLGRSYFVETGSKEGEKFLKKYKKFFKDSGKEDSFLMVKIKKEAAESITLRVDFFGAIKKLMKGGLPQENYQRIGERCIYCAGCLYVCPTCTCFNVFDTSTSSVPTLSEPRLSGGKVERVDYKDGRLRNWDACILEGYSREASTHNPRVEKWQRTARRYEHKLKYDYQTTGMSGCVGCGRCLESCPVNIGISKFIQEITENKKIM